MREILPAVFAQILNLLAPDQFDTTWLSKVSDVGDNKRLKLNNLCKVLTGTLDYLKDVVGMQLSQFPLPDINKVSSKQVRIRRQVLTNTHVYNTEVHAYILKCIHITIGR